MDHLGLRLANALVGNPDGAAAVEVTMRGPTLRFHAATVVAVVGAPFEVALNGSAVPMHRAVPVAAGDVLAVGSLSSRCGSRCYIAVRGSFDVPAGAICPQC